MFGNFMFRDEVPEWSFFGTTGFETWELRLVTIVGRCEIPVCTGMTFFGT